MQEQESKLEKPVYFYFPDEKFASSEFSVIVNPRRQVLDAFGQPHQLPGEYVAFQRGMATVVSVAAAEKVRNCEYYKKGWIKESFEPIGAIKQSSVGIHVGPVSSVAHAKPSHLAPVDKAPILGPVKGPKKRGK